MTSRQKSILLALIAANGLLLCGIVAFLALTSADQNPLQSAQDALQRARSSPAALSADAALPTPTLEPGWKIYRVPSDGFALALPASWRQLALNQNDLAAVANALGDKNPEFGTAPGSSVAPAVKFVAVDSAPEGTLGSFSTNVNIFHHTQLIEAPLEVYVPIGLKALQDLPNGSKPVLHRRVQTLAGAAEEFQYHNTLTLPNDQNVTTANREYLIVRGKEFFVITCTAPLNQEDRYAPIFEKIAAGFRWTGN